MEKGRSRDPQLALVFNDLTPCGWKGCRNGQNMSLLCLWKSNLETIGGTWTAARDDDGNYIDLEPGVSSADGYEILQLLKHPEPGHCQEKNNENPLQNQQILQKAECVYI